MDYRSVGSRMLADERRGDAADKVLLQERRRENLRIWREAVVTADESGVKLYPNDPPREFPERTAYDVPRPALPNSQHPSNNRTRVAQGRVY
jgi:hypothetical protein